MVVENIAFLKSKSVKFTLKVVKIDKLINNNFWHAIKVIGFTLYISIVKIIVVPFCQKII